MRTLPDPRVARLMYGALIADAADPLHVVASRSGISVYQLYAICEGRRHLLVERLRAILRALPADHATRLLSDLLDLPGLGLVLSEAPAASEIHSSDRRSAALKIAAKSGELAALVDQAEADGTLTDSERAVIREAAVKAMSLIEHLLGVVEIAPKPLAAVRSGR